MRQIYAPHLVLAGGLTGVGIFGYAAMRDGSKWVLCFMAALFLTYTAVDHFVFFADKDRTGVLSTEVANESGVECAAPYLVVRKVDRAFEYRCRTNIQLGHQLGTPFIPWPSYTSGSSEKLLLSFEKLQADVAVQRAERNAK